MDTDATSPTPDETTRAKPSRLRRVGFSIFRIALMLAAIGLGAWWLMIRMPGQSYRGPVAPPAEAELPELLRRDVEKLAGDIGQRNVFRYDNLAAAADYLETSLVESGYEVERQAFDVNMNDVAYLADRNLASDPSRDVYTCWNLAVELGGGASSDEIVVIGAHYDTIAQSPGANDNASGVAAMLALARTLSDLRPARTLRFVAFANEEPPFFQREQMGSLVYARRCEAQGDNIVAMLSLETIGYYSDRPHSQRYPPPFSMIYPSTGNFIGVIGNVSSRGLVRQVVGTLREHADFPCEGAAVPGGITGVGWSDHWAFWQSDYSAIMITDTALFRYPHYHLPSDLPEQLNYEKMARVVEGLEVVVRDLVGGGMSDYRFTCANGSRVRRPERLYPGDAAPGLGCSNCIASLSQRWSRHGVLARRYDYRAAAARRGVC